MQLHGNDYGENIMPMWSCGAVDHPHAEKESQPQPQPQPQPHTHARNACTLSNQQETGSSAEPGRWAAG
jgi:hypothetical protein